MSNVDVIVAIALMGVVTYLTRAGGVWLVDIVRTTPRLQRFLHHLSGSILAALTVTVAFSGDAARLTGVIAACAAMLVTRRAFLSLLLGTLMTAGVRLWGVA